MEPQLVVFTVIFCRVWGWRLLRSFGSFLALSTLTVAKCTALCCMILCNDNCPSQLESAVSEHGEGKTSTFSASVLSVALSTGFPVYFSRLEEARMRRTSKENKCVILKGNLSVATVFSFTRCLAIARHICWTVCQDMMERLQWTKKARSFVYVKPWSSSV